uniref:Uncharacterized protein n=1 Tax=Pseudo-nitzschia australis TaxID=44445 RepID=A0A7S4ER00_9STRA|mmetsp:Transcript_4886/g.10787  ORF Transcript_4886/g.10787 Transcript_4886/m.10787 type:complete len:130 (-) Transcript_4886:450-839(-)|eukprot:CAMPEP_0168194032 /NCGR_PEP_ID=MMETSP0139_2-20121125/18961_1 /TAXON_ID=44445 /ORGANISM="Pseudo-nitzschia australis, Strain 10249 10 AB" /LENGTH=129 /DNA_ID=CAMNT_0008117503 /DNA_START=97 /DNA_END=486 /DNA_ORIENTATION=-
MSEPKTNGRAESAPEDSSVSMTKTITRAFQNAATDDSEDEAVKVGLFWDEWSRCIGSSYQGDSLYRYGRLDSCGRQWRDLKLAAEARLTQWRDPKRAQELIDSTYYQKRTTISPTAGAIWELKERPGWD